MKEQLVSYDRVMQLIKDGRYHLKTLVKYGLMTETEAEIMDRAYRVLYESIEECKDDMIIDPMMDSKEGEHGKPV